MKSRFRLLVLPVFILLSSLVYCQQAEITNLIIAQRTDGSKLVDITFDISDDAVFSVFEVTVEISFDDGNTYVPLSHLTGDVGLGIPSGNDKQIIWNLGSEYEPLFTETSKFKIIAMGYIEEELPFAMVLVPAGEFTYGQNNEILNIDYDFEIMKYEVTNAQYAEFLIEALEAGDVWLQGVDAFVLYSGDEHYPGGNYSLGLLGPIIWNGTTFIVDEGLGNHPVTEVSWFGAWAFANFYGLRIPNEEEWEKTARGNTGWVYPWGNEINGSRANYRDSGDPWDNGTTPVGFYNGQNFEDFQTINSPSVFGAYDLTGNVEEWTTGWTQVFERVRRGGAWHESSNLETFFRNTDNPWGDHIGFRCSRTVE